MSHSFTEWLINQENTLFFAYVDRILALVVEDEKSVQKSAMSNLQLLLQTPNIKNKLLPKIDAITQVSDS